MCATTHTGLCNNRHSPEPTRLMHQGCVSQLLLWWWWCCRAAENHHHITESAQLCVSNGAVETPVSNNALCMQLRAQQALACRTTPTPLTANTLQPHQHTMRSRRYTTVPRTYNLTSPRGIHMHISHNDTLPHQQKATTLSEGLLHRGDSIIQPQ